MCVINIKLPKSFQSKYESLKLQLIPNTIKPAKTKEIPTAQIQLKPFEMHTQDSKYT